MKPIRLISRDTNVAKQREEYFAILVPQFAVDQMGCLSVFIFGCTYDTEWFDSVIQTLL